MGLSQAEEPEASLVECWMFWPSKESYSLAAIHAGFLGTVKKPVPGLTVVPHVQCDKEHMDMSNLSRCQKLVNFSSPWSPWAQRTFPIRCTAMAWARP